MTLDPNTYPTSADLSRADLRVLHHFCTDKDVVEFGMGGSTLFLYQIAKTLTSYDTSQEWVSLIKKHLPPEAALFFCLGVPYKLPKADVHFIDGASHLRSGWFRQCITERLAKTIIVHDSRRHNPVLQLSCLITWPYTAIIEKVEYHFMESNCLVVTLRDQPVAYEDWNVSEPENRLPHLKP